MLGATSFGEDLDRDLGPEGDGALGLVRGAAVRIWFRRFSTLRESRQRRLYLVAIIFWR